MERTLVAREAGQHEARARGPIRDPRALERVAALLRRRAA